MNAVERLQERLLRIPAGKVSKPDIAEVEACLSTCWDHLQGAQAQGGMQASKVIGRTENLEWHPPLLRFKIERHGAIAFGSTRAEIQTWEIDVTHNSAKLIYIGWRQHSPRAPRLDVKSLAAEIAGFVTGGHGDDRIQWRGTHCVKILTGLVIPATNNQTTSGRRRRFRVELESLLAPQGWHRKEAGSHLVFERGACPLGTEGLDQSITPRHAW